MKNILVIGTGFRASEDFIPVFKSMKEKIAIVGVYSRKSANVDRVAKRHNCPAVYSLDQVDWNKVDIVAMSITPSAVPSVLKVILQFGVRPILLIDTPVINRINFGAIKDLRNFQRVYVAEDYMMAPQFEVMRELVVKGYVGVLRSVQVVNSGFRYHAHALVRSFVGFKRPWLMQCFWVSKKTRIERCRFLSGVQSVVIDPYIRDSGYTRIEGSSRALVYGEGGSNESDCKLEAVVENSRIISFRLMSGNECKTEIECPSDLKEWQDFAGTDESRRDAMRRAALRTIAKNAAEERDVSYTFREAIWDGCMMDVLGKLRLIVNPFRIRSKGT